MEGLVLEYAFDQITRAGLVGKASGVWESVAYDLAMHCHMDSSIKVPLCDK